MGLNMLNERLKSLSGLRELGPLRYGFELPLELPVFQQLLEILTQERTGFSLFDKKYPSGSDPGAYMSIFFVNPGDNNWRLSLGNHGWSGGNYVLTSETVRSYLAAAVSSGVVTEIKIENKGARHYKDESTEVSSKMAAKLIALHSAQPSKR
jgi:hypothetical protein